MRAVGNDWEFQSWAVTWSSCVLERSFWWICRAWAETRVVKGPVTGDGWASSGLEKDENPSWDGGYFSLFSLLQTACYKLKTGWLKQQKLTSHNSGGWGVRDQGAGWFSVWWELSFWFAHNHLLAVLRQREGETEREIIFPASLLVKALMLFMRAPPST